MKSLELFEKREGKWVPLRLGNLVGKPVRAEAWRTMDGKEIVGKLTSDGEVVGYVAGTDEVRQHYAGRTGKRVWSWDEAAAMMEMTGSSLLDDDQNWLGSILETFGDECAVVRIDYGMPPQEVVDKPRRIGYKSNNNQGV